MAGVTWGGRGGLLLVHARDGWARAKVAKRDGKTLEQAMRSSRSPGKAKAFKEGWLAFEAGLPCPERKP